MQGKNSAKKGSLPCSRQYTQNARLSKSCQNTRHQNGFRVVRQKVANIDNPRDCGTVVGEDQTPYVILALWAINGLSIVCWELKSCSQPGDNFWVIIVTAFSPRFALRVVKKVNTDTGTTMTTLRLSMLTTFWQHFDHRAFFCVVHTPTPTITGYHISQSPLWLHCMAYKGLW